MCGGSAGFSRNASIVLPSGPTLMMPKAEASLFGTGMAATVTPARGPRGVDHLLRIHRYTWSAPTTITMFGCCR